MTPRRLERLFNSVFTRLLLAILIAGLAITLTVIVGFLVIRLHTESAFERNLQLYADYLTTDMGDPPSQARASEIAGRTGLVIRFEHPDHAWQTGSLPRSFDTERAWGRRRASGLWMGGSRGHHFIRLDHGGGQLIFVAPRTADHGEVAGWVLAALAATLTGILGAAYFYLRRLLKPLRALKHGAGELGAGRLGHRIAESGRSELRDLARAFNAMADRLARLLHSKERLLLDVSHELRSPITRLKVQLEFLDDDELRESLRGDVADLEAMVTTLLESARLRHAAAALDRRPIAVGELIRSLVPEFEHRRPGLVLGALVDDPIPADAEKIKTVLRNLVDNALNHSPETGRAVCIAMRPDPDRLEIEVTDRGEGIPAAELPHLFEPFYRADRSRSRKTGGFGLGLSLCKAIVDAHGGAIELTSSPGRGTRVTVGLPRTP